MTPQAMIARLNIDTEPPPWDGDVREIHASLMVNYQPVRVQILDVYEYWDRQMVTVQAIKGRPFLHTNTWYHTWHSDTCNTHLTFLQDIVLVY